jgi:hypothetical protein
MAQIKRKPRPPAEPKATAEPLVAWGPHPFAPDPTPTLIKGPGGWWPVSRESRR